ncbi:hypothetical protein BC628DRAFT_1422262 [Trametes gibbosa]|nr:hypothetical protein BC628DRAFT_1422262 [Trametes gibbosa]
MADSSDQENQELITALHLFTVSNICEIAGVALLAYDHLLTFSGEVQFVWDRKFSGATVIFLLNRYITLFNKILLPISTFWWPNQTDKKCAAPVILTEIFTVIAYFIVALFSALRVYAIWNKDWRPFLLVLIIALSVPATNMYHYVLSIPQAFLYPLYGCAESTALSEDQLEKYFFNFLTFGTLELTLPFCAIAADLFVLLLTWVKTYEIKKLASGLHSEATFSSLLLRDGTLYFGTMLMLNVVDLAVLQSDVLFNPLPIFIDVFTCILISRFMLNLRQVAHRESGDAGSTSEAFLSRLSTLRFSPDVVGDLGAPLSHGDWTQATAPVANTSFTESTHAQSDIEATIRDERRPEDVVGRNLRNGHSHWYSYDLEPTSYC